MTDWPRPHAQETQHLPRDVYGMRGMQLAACGHDHDHDIVCPVCQRRRLAREADVLLVAVWPIYVSTHNSKSEVGLRAGLYHCNCAHL